MNVIVARGLGKRYRRAWALDHVDLSMEPGGAVALVGPNGAGKSTLLKLCVGFERPTDGRLEVFGVDPTRDRAAAIARIGFVPQAPSLYRELSVDEHVELARSFRDGFDAAYARARLRQLDIRLHARPQELSGGQQAQVSLAIALGTRAPLLLLDEPLANLDPLARRELLTVVGDATASGDVTAVLASHVIADVEPIADRLLVLGHGQVLLQTTVPDAIASHLVAEDGSTGPAPSVVARFPDRHGAVHQLLRAGPGVVGRAPTLEEVVIGYLASARAIDVPQSLERREAVA